MERKTFVRTMRPLSGGFCPGHCPGHCPEPLSGAIVRAIVRAVVRSRFSGHCPEPFSVTLSRSLAQGNCIVEEPSEHGTFEWSHSHCPYCPRYCLHCSNLVLSVLSPVLSALSGGSLAPYLLSNHPPTHPLTCSYERGRE